MEQLADFVSWLESQAKHSPYFAGTFWLIWSHLEESLLVKALQLVPVSKICEVPSADSIAHVTITTPRFKGAASFWHLPFHHPSVHLFFSRMKPCKAVRFVYRLTARARGRAQLFPLGHDLARSCARLNPAYPLDHTRVLRGVSYPSRPEDGGAEINLLPGNAVTFFQKVEDEGRILKLAKMRSPVLHGETCDFTICRIGYISYHRGKAEPLLRTIVDRLSKEMIEAARPFQQADHNFVGLRFGNPVFADMRSFHNVLHALARVPRTAVAIIHANPYFHATLTNYEDGGEFDVFITDPSTIHLQARGESSPASFVRLHNSLCEAFTEARVSIEHPKMYSLRDLLDGRV